MTALHYAAEHGQVDLINQLLDMGADVQAMDEDVLPLLAHSQSRLRCLQRSPIFHPLSPHCSAGPRASLMHENAGAQLLLRYKTQP